MPSAGAPRLRGVARQGKKWTGRRCGQTIEAQPALGQIRPSEVGVARPERARWRRGAKLLHDASVQTDGAWKDLRWRINGGASSLREPLFKDRFFSEATQACRVIAVHARELTCCGS